MAKGTLTIREKDPVQLTRDQWAARFKATPVAELICTCANTPHVHARHQPRRWFLVDPVTGRWLNPDREAS